MKFSATEDADHSARLNAAQIYPESDLPLPVDPMLAQSPADTSPALSLNEEFFLKLGFSFLVGMAVGFALKVAFKVALVVLGVILIGVYALQYADLVDVNWSGIESHYDTWAGWLGVRGSAFLDFMGENLSSSASFLAGLALGLKL